MWKKQIDTIFKQKWNQNSKGVMINLEEWKVLKRSNLYFEYLVLTNKHYWTLLNSENDAQNDKCLVFGNRWMTEYSR